MPTPVNARFLFVARSLCRHGALWLAALYLFVALVFGYGPSSFELSLRRYMTRDEASVGIPFGSLRGVRADEYLGATPSSLSHAAAASFSTDYDVNLIGPRLAVSDPYASAFSARGWMMPTSWPYFLPLGRARQVAVSYAWLQALILVGAYLCALLLVRQAWLANIAALSIGLSLLAQTWLVSGIGYCFAALGFALSGVQLLLLQRRVWALCGAGLLFVFGGALLFATYPPATIACGAVGLVMLPLFLERATARHVLWRCVAILAVCGAVVAVWFEQSKPLLTALSKLFLASRVYTGTAASIASVVHDVAPQAGFVGVVLHEVSNICEDSRIAFVPLMALAVLSMRRPTLAWWLSLALFSVVLLRVYMGGFEAAFAALQANRVSQTRWALTVGYSGVLLSVVALARRRDLAPRHLVLWVAGAVGFLALASSTPFNFTLVGAVLIVWSVVVGVWVFRHAYAPQALVLAVTSLGISSGFLFNPLRTIAAVESPPPHILELREAVGEGTLLELSGRDSGNTLASLGIKQVLGWHPLGSPELGESLAALTRDHRAAHGYCYLEGRFGEGTRAAAVDQAHFDLNPCDSRWSLFGVNVMVVATQHAQALACRDDFALSDLKLGDGVSVFVAKRPGAMFPLEGAELLDFNTEANALSRRYRAGDAVLEQQIAFQRRALVIRVRLVATNSDAQAGPLRTPALLNQVLTWESHLSTGATLNNQPEELVKDPELPLVKRVSLDGCIGLPEGCELLVDLL